VSNLFLILSNKRWYISDPGLMVGGLGRAANGKTGLARLGQSTDLEN